VERNAGGKAVVVFVIVLQLSFDSESPLMSEDKPPV
jgi:hypothetical protein